MYLCQFYLVINSNLIPNQKGEDSGEDMEFYWIFGKSKFPSKKIVDFFNKKNSWSFINLTSHQIGLRGTGV